MPLLHLSLNINTQTGTCVLNTEAQIPPQQLELTQYAVRNGNVAFSSSYTMLVDLPFISTMDIRSSLGKHGAIPLNVKQLAVGEVQITDVSMRFQISKAIQNQFTAKVLYESASGIQPWNGSGEPIIIDLYFTYNRYNIF